MNFGNRLIELRNEFNLDRDELANALNISYSSLSKYETNKRFPSQDLLISIANYFGVSIDYLLGRTDIRNYEEYTIAAHTDDRTQQLSDEDRKQLDDFIDFLIAKSKKNE